MLVSAKNLGGSEFCVMSKRLRPLHLLPDLGVDTRASCSAVALAITRPTRQRLGHDLWYTNMGRIENLLLFFGRLK